MRTLKAAVSCTAEGLLPLPPLLSFAEGFEHCDAEKRSHRQPPPTAQSSISMRHTIPPRPPLHCSHFLAHTLLGVPKIGQAESERKCSSTNSNSNSNRGLRSNAGAAQ